MFLYDGYQTLVSVSVGSFTAVLREKEVQPSPLEGGGKIDTTTMRNTGFRTAQPKSLTTMGEMVLHCQYDPTAYSLLTNFCMQRLGVITVTFPDGTVDTFPGWVEDFKPTSHKEGEMPTAEVKIIPSLQNPAITGSAGMVLPVANGVTMTGITGGSGPSRT